MFGYIKSITPPLDMRNKSTVYDYIVIIFISFFIKDLSATNPHPGTKTVRSYSIFIRKCNGFLVLILT